MLLDFPPITMGKIINDFSNISPKFTKFYWISPQLQRKKFWIILFVHNISNQLITSIIVLYMRKIRLNLTHFNFDKHTLTSLFGTAQHSGKSVSARLVTTFNIRVSLITNISIFLINMAVIFSAQCVKRFDIIKIRCQTVTAP